MLLFWDSGVKSASFDCKNAMGRIERLICDSPDLNSLDSQLEGAYLGALDRSNDPPQLKQKQLAWLKQRDACVDTKCLSALILQRIELLSAISDEPPDCSGATTREVNSCASEYSRRADRELARYVAAARRRLADESKEGPDRQALKAMLADFDASQAAWAAYRKAECEAVYRWWSDGAIRGLMYGTCWQSVTKSRTTTIWSNWLQFGDSTPALMPKPNKH